MISRLGNKNYTCDYIKTFCILILMTTKSIRLNNKESIPTIYASICEVFTTIHAEQILIRFKLIVRVCIEMNYIVVILEHM